MDEILKIAGPLIGALIGGFIALRASHNQFTRQRQFEYEKRRVEKLEQIYELFIRLASWYSHSGMEYISEILAKNRGEKFTKYDFSKEGHNKFDYSKLKMLVIFYAQDLRPELEEQAAAGGKFAAIQTKDSVTVKELLDAYKEMSNSMQALTSLAEKKLESMINVIMDAKSTN